MRISNIAVVVAAAATEDGECMSRDGEVGGLVLFGEEYYIYANTNDFQREEK